jgi:hypothetical protein
MQAKNMNNIDNVEAKFMFKMWNWSNKFSSFQGGWFFSFELLNLDMVDFDLKVAKTTRGVAFGTSELVLAIFVESLAI